MPSIRTGLALLALIVSPLVADDGACPEMPATWSLEPGQEMRLGQMAIVLDVDATEDGRSVDLRVRRMDDRRRALGGSFIPHLDVDYAFSGEDRSSSGKLAFRVSPRGPSYGAEIALPESPTGIAPTLEITIRQRADAITAGPTCPHLPLHLNTVLSDPGSVGPLAAEPPLASEDDQRMTVVGTLDPIPAESTPYNDVWGYSSGGTHLAILGAFEGTYFIDVTDPGNPVEIAFIDGPDSGWRDMKTYLNYAYIVTEGFGTGQGVQIVDLSDPLDPTLVNVWDDTFVTAHNIFIDTAIGQAWVVGTNNGSRVLDLSQDPENPVEVGSFGAEYVHDAFVKGNFAYMSEIFAGTHEILDSSDPSNLESVSVVATPTNFTHNSWTNDDDTVMITTDETNPGGHVGIWDITDKSDPILLGEYQPQENPTTLVHNAFIDDDDDERVAMSHYAIGMKYLDIHVPTIPIEIGSYDTYPQNDNNYNGAWGVYPFDPRGYIYVSDRSTGLYVLEYAPTGGTLSGLVTDASNGQPLPDAEILILPSNLEQSSDLNGLFGVYVDEGHLAVKFTAVGYKSRIVTGTMPLGGRLEFDVALEPLPSTSLSGTVRRSDDLQPVAGATVAVVGTPLSTVSAADGSFVFPSVAVGQRIVTAEAFGYASDEDRIVLTLAGGVSADLRLEPGRFVDDMETDLGWTSIGLGLTSGQWERVDPNGTNGGQVQPEDDHTPAPGVTAFITGQSPPGSPLNDNDVEGGVARLASPAIDLEGVGAARVRFHRWVSNNAGVFVVGSLSFEAAPDDSSFVTLETQSTNANSWIRREFDLGSAIALTNDVHLRFSAQPGAFDPLFQVLECGVDDVDVVRACLARFSPEIDDVDIDGTVDVCDGCPEDSADDADGDGFCGNEDNAPFTHNPDQTDADDDGVGDAADNCVSDANPAQRDLDLDGAGDACDDDLDGDAVPDAIDDDDDDDGVLDGIDVCPAVPDPAQLDDDDDGQGNACDDDDGLVQGVRLEAGNLITWEPEVDADAYNLYRGDIGAELLLPLSRCRAAGIATRYQIDPDLPPPGAGFLYLVTRTAAGEEGPWGRKSNGADRSIDGPCP